MQKIGVATFVALLTTFSNVYSESAKAAEITEKNALVMEKSAHNWAGSYAGVNGGYAHFQDRVDVHNEQPGPFGSPDYAPALLTTKIHGITGGVQYGYNTFYAKRWLLGLEADFEMSSSSGLSDASSSNGVKTSLHSSLDWFTTIRPRIGVMNGRSLWYITGGVALAHTTTTVSSDQNNLWAGNGSCCISQSSRSDLRGGWTVGGGYESRLSESISLKIEYLHLDLGKTSGSMNYRLFGSNFVTRYSSYPMYEIARIGINFKLDPFD